MQHVGGKQDGLAKSDENLIHLAVAVPLPFPVPGGIMGVTLAADRANLA
jgi:hypothetical protein